MKRLLIVEDKESLASMHHLESLLENAGEEEEQSLLSRIRSYFGL